MPTSRIYDLSDRIFELDGLELLDLGFSDVGSGGGGTRFGFGFGITNGGLGYLTEEGPIGYGMGIRIGSAGAIAGPSELDVGRLAHMLDL